MNIYLIHISTEAPYMRRDVDPVLRVPQKIEGLAALVVRAWHLFWKVHLGLFFPTTNVPILEGTTGATGSS